MPAATTTAVARPSMMINARGIRDPEASGGGSAESGGGSAESDAVSPAGVTEDAGTAGSLSGSVGLSVMRDIRSRVVLRWPSGRMPLTVGILPARRADAGHLERWRGQWARFDNSSVGVGCRVEA